MSGNKITGLQIEGFKSFGKEQKLQIRPLTLLAGANSSGKSSVVQPLLLLKQTLEAPVDYGPLKLDGPNVHFSRSKELFTQSSEGETATSLRIGLEYEHDPPQKEKFRRALKLEFRRSQDETPLLEKQIVRDIPRQQGLGSYKDFVLVEGELAEEAIPDCNWLGEEVKFYLSSQPESVSPVVRVYRNRCFLDLALYVEDFLPLPHYSFSSSVVQMLTNILYVPGLRDPSRQRSYPKLPIGEHLTAPMQDYSASVIESWGPDSKSLRRLEQDMRELGLADGVSVRSVDDTALEIFVGRHLPGRPHAAPSTVHLADVGLGVSQVMPILTALHVARKQHLVVIEQPELHIHPRGIYRLASIIAGAAERGVKVIVETHSELLLLGLQTAVAKGSIDPQQVSLNWFELDKQGNSVVRQADVEQDGSFGDWPVDFLDVELQAQRLYLDASERQ